MTGRSGVSFITWYPYCRRSDTIAERLGGPSHLIHYLGFKRPLHAPFKYLRQAWETRSRLDREQPGLVLVAVPPTFAALAAGRWARRNGAKLVIDAHTGIFQHRLWTWLEPLNRRLFRDADAVVVTNDALAETVRGWGGRPVVIGTVPVEFGPGKPPVPCVGPRVVVVNTFSVDEPVGELLEAARTLPHIRFQVTGDRAAARREWIESAPANVELTGFVSEEEYAGLLRAADTVVVLTTDDNTMQRGAYEAMALAKPLVTSSWPILTETFSRGTVHVENDAGSIARGIASALEEREVLAREMAGLRETRRQEFEGRLTALLEEIGFSGALPERSSAAEGRGRLVVP